MGSVQQSQKTFYWKKAKVDPVKDMEIIMNEDLAKIMWSAYCNQAGGVTFDGKPLPSWDDLGLDCQMCWIAAADAAATYLTMV